MNPSPARTVLDEVITWAGIPTQPPREAPPQSCSREMSFATKEPRGSGLFDFPRTL